MERRIDQILSLVMKLAAGEMSAREEPSNADDDLDAIIVGVNMLAEELEASRTDLEQRVASRTAELVQLNLEIMKLTELGSLLQACETREEAHAVMRHGVGLMFARVSGSVYVFNSSRNLLEQAVTWGDAASGDPLVREDCWALRRGLPHQLRDEGLALPCAHVAPGTVNSVCIPMAARGETVGLLHLTSGRGVPDSAIGDAYLQLGVAVGTQLALALANLELRQTLSQQALHDSLTGLYNRRFIDDWVARGQPGPARRQVPGCDHGRYRPLQAGQRRTWP